MTHAQAFLSVKEKKWSEVSKTLVFDDVKIKIKVLPTELPGVTVRSITLPRVTLLCSTLVRGPTAVRDLSTESPPQRDDEGVSYTLGARV